jgi:hypothetical protein
MARPPDESCAQDRGGGVQKDGKPIRFESQS